MTEKEAYAAMYAYLVMVYQRTKSDDIGSLLGDMSTLPDGETADPAVWHEWLKCVEKAKQGEVDTRLNLTSENF